MSGNPIAAVERELLSWPGVWKKKGEDEPGGIGLTGYRLGRRQIGHVHDDGHADFRFPSEMRDGLIRTGKAFPTPRSRTAGRRPATTFSAPSTYPGRWNSSA